MYFPFFKPRTGNKRYAAQPQTIYSEFPKGNRVAEMRKSGSRELTHFFIFFKER